MNDEINYKNNPLHGVGLKDVLVEMVDHYGFEILYAYLNINCFKTKPSIESSVKFLKKTDWAREKVEAFYMYKFKNLPKASPSQRELPPRDRIVPDGQVPGEPAKLSLDEAEHLRKEREKRAAEFDKSGGRRSGHSSGKGDQGSGPRRGGRSSAAQRSSPWDQAKKGGKDTSSSNGADHSSAPDPWGSWKK